jgi:hypothetical protein
MTSLPAARARTTLVEARHPVDPIGRTVAARTPVENAAMAQAVPPAVVPERAQERAQRGAREEPRAGADRNVMTEVPLLVRAEVNGAVIAGLMVRVVVMTAA